MNDESLKKFNRIIAILTQLQSKNIVRAQDLANRFEVSLRTIYRDIRSLERAGIPIISEAGIGYSIMEGYHLPPIMFNKEEALSFITAEKLMQRLTDEGISSYYESAMIKIKSVLRSAEKEWIHHIENQINIQPTKNLFNTKVKNSLEFILGSIVEKKQIILEYKAISDEITYRSIEPVGVFYENNFWYILGYCLLRKDYRQFRTDRIIQIKSTYSDFTQIHGNLSDYKTDYKKGPKTQIRIVVDKKAAKYLINSKNNYGFISELETSKGIEMVFMTSDIEEEFPRWFLSFADYAYILEPDILKKNVRKLFKKISQKGEMIN